MKKMITLKNLIAILGAVVLASGVGNTSFAEGVFTFPSRDEWREETEHTRIEYLEDAFAAYNITAVSEKDVEEMPLYEEKDWTAFWNYGIYLHNTITKMSDEHRLLEEEKNIVLEKYLYRLYADIENVYENTEYAANESADSLHNQFKALYNEYVGGQSENNEPAPSAMSLS